MNGYICFYLGKRIEIHADTSLKAQQEAARVLNVKPKNQYKISVHLAELAGEQVTHVAVD
jgi:hypothetical protein